MRRIWGWIGTVGTVAAILNSTTELNFQTPNTLVTDQAIGRVSEAINEHRPQLSPSTPYTESCFHTSLPFSKQQCGATQAR